MNAYELADELLRDNTQLTVKAAYMLRQQADRIADLETTLAFKKMKPLSDEEIIAEAEKFGVIIADTGLKAIKAILRKAQDK